MDISVIGGTDHLGFGLALRFAHAGHHVTIGSRKEERGREMAEKAVGILGGGNIDGTANPEAAAVSEVVIITVPFEGLVDTYKVIGPRMPEGTVLCDTTNAIGKKARELAAGKETAPTEEAALLVPHVRLVAAFQTVSSHALWDIPNKLDGDVFVCGPDASAKEAIGGLVDQMPDLRWVDIGPLSRVRTLAKMTEMLISVNRRYGISTASFKMMGKDTWGAPPPKPESAAPAAE